MLFKDIGKMIASASGQSTMFLEGIFCFCFIAFMYTVLKKIEEKAENAEGSLNSLVLEKNCIVDYVGRKIANRV